MPLLLSLSLSNCAWTPEAKKAQSLERADGYYDQEQYREAVIEYRNVLQIDENDPHATQRLGLSLFQLGQIGQAFRFLQKSRELNPNDSESRLKLAMIYLLGRRQEEARDEATYVLQDDPNNLDALIVIADAATTPEEVDAALAQLELVRADHEDKAKFHLAIGNLYIKKRDMERAEQAFKSAAAAEPDSVHAHLALGNFYLTKRELDLAEEEFKSAADLAPKQSLVQIKLVDFYIATQNTEQAKTLLADLVEEVPDFLPAWRRLAEVNFAERNYEDAARALDTFLEKSPNDPDAIELRGRIHAARGEAAEAVDRYREAIKLFQEYVKRRPNNPSAHYRLARAHLRLGELSQAQLELEEVRRLAPGSAPARLLLAELNLRSGEADSIIEDIGELVKEQPSAQAYKFLGIAYTRKGDLPAALDAFQNAVGLVPGDSEARYNLGVTLRDSNPTDAKRQFEAALAISPGYIEPLTQLASMAMGEQKPAEAVMRIQKQIELVPNSGAHYYLLGTTYLASRDIEKATDAFVKSTELEPSMLSAYVRLASIYASTGQFDEALGKMNEALAQKPNDVPTLMLVGMLQHQKGDLLKARENYEKILEIKSDFAPAANNLAYIVAENDGDLERALQLAEVARGAAPDNPNIADTLAWILYKRGTYDRALSLLKEASTKLSNNAEVQYHLGMTYYKLNDLEAAWLALKRALELSSDFPGADEAREVYAALERMR
jgi:tetratricopeptide (TPR) repeat protein